MTTSTPTPIAIDPAKLAEFEALILDHGSHSTFTKGHCAMEVVAWLADEGHTDAPSCASPLLRRFTITLNDRWDDEKRQLLKPYLLRMIGTGNDGKDPARERIAARYVAGLVVPWLRLAGLDTEADRLQAAGGDLAQVRAAMWSARDAAWSVRNAKRAELKAKILPLVREHLAKNAAVAAAAVAAAAAAAGATYSERWSAAYDAARAYYREHPLPITQEAASIAASQDGAALELLGRLIDADEAVL